MKIAILGTRGIPNNYGGFEQFAAFLSKGLTDLGHQIYVYSPHDHPYKETTWENVNLIHIHNPEKYTGTWGQFIYDLFCILDSRKRKFDIIFQLGYTSSSVWGKLLPGRALTVTNMDGLEWKRTKYSNKVRKFLKYAEKLAVKTSHFLVADSKGIQSYLLTKYNKTSEYIPYGTNIFKHPDAKLIEPFNVTVYGYNMLIARMESENNIETILDGICASKNDRQILVIGNPQNAFGKYLTQKFATEKRIRFLGPLYDIDSLNNLRYYSNIYFHGHSVGGTNPSLLEAMGSSALICAHQNEFNMSILEKDAFYFSSSHDVAKLLDGTLKKENYAHFISSNLQKVEDLYLWPNIISHYENYFSGILNPHSQK